MNHTEKEFITMLEALADMTGMKATPFIMGFYADNLRAFRWERVNKALLGFMEDARKFPTVAEVKEKLGILPVKPVTAEDNAREAVSRIWEAMRTCGWNRPKEAQAFIGELGWKVVERYGGWSAVTDLEEDQRMGITAQMRDLAISLQKFSSHGINTGPTLPESNAIQRALWLAAKGIEEKDNPSE